MHDLAPLYAIDALEGDECAAFEAHLADCPRCRSEVQDLRETAALLAHAGSAAPEGLWDRIASELDDAPDGVAPVLPFARGTKAKRWRTALVAVAAVAAAIVGVNTAVIVRQNDRIDDLTHAQAISLLRQRALDAQIAPGSRTARLGSGATAVVTEDGKGYLVTSFDKLDAAHSYQLWGFGIDGKPISLGVLGRTPEVAQFAAKIAVSKLAVTIEAAKGALAPTTPPIASGQLA